MKSSKSRASLVVICNLAAGWLICIVKKVHFYGEYSGLQNGIFSKFVAIFRPVVAVGGFFFKVHPYLRTRCANKGANET